MIYKTGPVVQRQLSMHKSFKKIKCNDPKCWKTSLNIEAGTVHVSVDCKQFIFYKYVHSKLIHTVQNICIAVFVWAWTCSFFFKCLNFLFHMCHTKISWKCYGLIAPLRYNERLARVMMLCCLQFWSVVHFLSFFLFFSCLRLCFVSQSCQLRRVSTHILLIKWHHEK